MNVVVLAAGRGVRMGSQLPKVLHPVAGSPMLARILNSATRVGSQTDPCGGRSWIGCGQFRGWKIQSLML